MSLAEEHEMNYMYHIYFGLEIYQDFYDEKLTIHGCLNSLDYSKQNLSNPDESVQKAISCCFVRNNIIDTERFKKYPPSHYSNIPISEEIEKVLGNTEFVQISKFLNNQSCDYIFTDLYDLFVNSYKRNIQYFVPFHETYELDVFDFGPNFIHYGLNTARFKTNYNYIQLDKIKKDTHYAIQIYNTFPKYRKQCVERFIKHGYYIVEDIIKYDIMDLIPNSLIDSSIFNILLKELPEKFKKYIIIASIHSEETFYLNNKETIDADSDILTIAIKTNSKNIITDQINKSKHIDINIEKIKDYSCYL